MRRVSLLLALLLLVTACSGNSRPSVDEYGVTLGQRMAAKSDELADFVDLMEVDGFNIGWDYLDATGSRGLALSELFSITCVEMYLTGDADRAALALERELAHTIRYQNDALVIVMLSQWAQDELCYDHATYGR